MSRLGERVDVRRSGGVTVGRAIHVPEEEVSTAVALDEQLAAMGRGNGRDRGSLALG